MDLAEFGVRQGVSILGAGGDRRVPDFVEAEIVPQMLMDGLDRGIAAAQGHPRATGRER